MVLASSRLELNPDFVIISPFCSSSFHINPENVYPCFVSTLRTWNPVMSGPDCLSIHIPWDQELNSSSNTTCYFRSLVHASIILLGPSILTLGSWSRTSMKVNSGSGTGLERQSEMNLPVKGYCFTRACSRKIPSNPRATRHTASHTCGGDSCQPWTRPQPSPGEWRAIPGWRLRPVARWI